MKQFSRPSFPFRCQKFRTSLYFLQQALALLEVVPDPYHIVNFFPSVELPSFCIRRISSYLNKCLRPQSTLQSEGKYQLHFIDMTTEAQVLHDLYKALKSQ